MSAQTDELVLEEISTKEGIGESAQLIVYNDDVNTFDWVIQCFVEILNHTDTQAEQCAMLVHFKGKATVKSAHLEVLNPLKVALQDRGLSAVIEVVEV